MKNGSITESSGPYSHLQRSQLRRGLRPNMNNNKQAQPLSNLVANHSEQTQLLFWLVRINRPLGRPLSNELSLYAQNSGKPAPNSRPA